MKSKLSEILPRNTQEEAKIFMNLVENEPLTEENIRRMRMLAESVASVVAKLLIAEDVSLNP